MRKVFIFSIFCFQCLPGISQDLLKPGKKSFDKKWIKSSVYRMTWYALKDTVKYELGKVTTGLTTDKRNLTIVTQISMKNVTVPWIDSTIADLKTLKPVRHSSNNSRREMVLNFGKVITGVYNDKVTNKNIVVNDTAMSTFFDSNLYPFLIGWLPLHNGYRKDIAIYDYNPSGKIGALKASVQDVQSGTYQSEKNGTRNVWIVTVTDEIGNGDNGSCTYYFDKLDRKLWKQEIQAKNRKMMMIVIE